MKEFDEYQKWTESTWHGQTGDKALVHAAFGLAEEVGEVIGKLKKILRGDKGEVGVMAGISMAERCCRDEGIKKELGDSAYYLARLCAECGFIFSEVVAANVAKLEDRKARGVLGGSGDTR